MSRAIILLLDSFGIGALPDADKFGDVGTNTLGHIAENYNLKLPNMTRLGLNAAAKLATGKSVAGLSEDTKITGLYGAGAEKSLGKDTSSGHWEIAGVPVLFEWGYFPKTIPCFPKELIDEFVKRGNLPGVLGEKHASGTEILKELGEEHIKTGKPIVYTSADSVFQIAAHEEHFGLERLYELCEIAFELVKPYNIGRVIARPFLGTNPDDFKRTANRHDYSVMPPALTLLDKLKENGNDVIAIGKITDIYANSGITKTIKASGNMNLFDATVKAFAEAPDGSLTFTNFVDFDMEYGHRRDIDGYAKALEDFDARIPEMEALLKPDDIMILTADHGCDPTYKGSDHTREHIPILVSGPNVAAGSIGVRETFSDIGQSIAKHLGIKPLEYGESFL